MARTTKRARRSEPRKKPFKRVEVVEVPLLVSRKEAAALFGRTQRWFDLYLQMEGVEILKASRVMNGRRYYKTRAILDHIDGLPS